MIPSHVSLLQCAQVKFRPTKRLRVAIGTRGGGEGAKAVKHDVNLLI